MTIHEAQQHVLVQLEGRYEKGEASAITNLVLENITDRKKIDRIIHKQEFLSPAQVERIESYARDLGRGRPVQYVLQESWFCGLKFYVDENVLIPRPETEELVNWIVEDVHENQPLDGRTSPAPPSTFSGTILDVGSGSGCIPVALKKKLGHASVFSCDVSEKALDVARRNAVFHKAEVHFLLLDFLRADQASQLPSCDIIVSNPPYIPISEKRSMPAHVTDFEPPLALFVQDDDPLIFYEAIAGFAAKRLLPGGSAYVELHENLHAHVKKLFLQKNFSSVALKKDLYGKNRMLKATLLP